MPETIKVVCGHCNTDVSNAPQVVAANARIEALEARVERARAEIREFKAAGEYEFEPTTAPEAFLQQELKQLMSALLAILEGDTE